MSDSTISPWFWTEGAKNIMKIIRNFIFFQNFNFLDWLHILCHTSQHGWNLTWSIFFQQNIPQGSQKTFPIDIHKKIAVVDSPLGVYVDKKLRIPRVKYHTLMPLVNSIIINPTIYFNLFHPKLLFCPMKSFHTSLNIAHSGCNPSIIMSKHFYTLPKFSCPCPHISPLPPPHFHRYIPNQSIPNHLHVYSLNA